MTHTCEVLVVAPLLCIICDNPSASEVVNHLRGAAARFCRICNVNRADSPPQFGQLRNSGSCLRQIIEIRSQNREANKTGLRRIYGLTDVHNPLLVLPVDLYQSTPIEVPHTILLGPYKYLTRQIMGQLQQQQKEEVCQGYV